jgi:hypothetical protein
MTEQEIDIVVEHLRVQAVHARSLAGGGEYQTTQNSRHWANAARAFEEAANIMADPAAEITRLRAELAEAREAVVVLAEGIKAAREQRTHEYKDGIVPGGPVWLRLETACRNIFNNPIADAAVKKAGGGA